MSTLTQDVTELRKSIADEHKKAIGAAKKSLEHIRVCGELLIELKAKVEHGQFRRELIHLRIKPTTAANYMRVADKWATVAHLPRMRDALRLLSKGDAPLEMPDSSNTSPPEIKLRSAPTAPASGKVIEAEVILDTPPPAPQPMEDEESKPLVVDGTKQEKPLTKKESARLAELEKTIDNAINPQDGEPIDNAIQRLVFILLHHKWSAEYINGLADSLLVIKEEESQ
jgi:hypothetical protein